ncbi:hypothetical protein WJX72_011507 [[Myrmecia] bisecta]|uniref:Reticulon domain-containing protein n=1 Tax=[Myrmecia] bisecta TaxID=41462 RepID=A0AAW1QTI0_9CHLO
MTVYECKCGFASGSALGIQRHLLRFDGQDGEHRMVDYLKRNSPKEQQAAGGPDQPAEPQAHPPDRSWFGGLGSLWTSPGGSIKTSEDAEPDAGKLGRANHVAGNAAANLARVGSDASIEEIIQPQGRSSHHNFNMDSGSWEAVSEVSNGDGDYRDITQRLAAAGQETPAAEPAGPAGSGGSVSAAVQRTLEAIGWRPSRDVDTSVQEGGCANSVAEGFIPVEGVEGVLLWTDPWLSAKVFGCGMYFLICMSHLVAGVELLQPSTAVAACVLCALLYKTLRRLWRLRRTASHPHLEGGLGELSQEDEEALMQRTVANNVVAAAQLVAPLIAAAITMVNRRISGYDKLGTTVWLALTLWLVMCIGELHLVTQSGLAMGCWVAVFTLPSFYMQCRSALDVLVDELMAFMSVVVLGGQKGSLVMAGGAGLILFVSVDASIFVRLSLSSLLSVAVLILRARHARLGGDLLNSPAPSPRPTTEAPQVPNPKS